MSIAYPVERQLEDLRVHGIALHLLGSLTVQLQNSVIEAMTSYLEIPVMLRLVEA